MNNFFIIIVSLKVNQASEKKEKRNFSLKKKSVKLLSSFIIYNYCTDFNEKTKQMLKSTYIKFLHTLNFKCWLERNENAKEIN